MVCIRRAGRVGESSSLRADWLKSGLNEASEPTFHVLPSPNPLDEGATVTDEREDNIPNEADGTP